MGSIFMTVDLAMDSYIWHQKHKQQQKKKKKRNWTSSKWNTFVYQGTLSPANRIGGRFGNHISDQGLVSRIRNECFLLNSKANNPIKNAQRTWAGISPNRYSSGKQAYERYSTRLVRKEMQIKATTTCHFTLTGRPLRQQQWKVTNVGEDVRK